MEHAVDNTQDVTGKNKTKLESTLARFIQNKEIAKERNEENKVLAEEIESLFEELGENEFVHQLSSGEFVVVQKKPRFREVLDKDGLAITLGMTKDEIKTPFDISMLTQQGKLTPKMISKHTENITDLKFSIGKRKTKPKPKKDGR